MKAMIAAEAGPAAPAVPLRRTGPAGTRPPHFVLGGALLLFFLRFGYDYGVSDQDEILPLLLHRLEPELFASDWFVRMQASAFGIRTLFVAVLQGVALLLPVWLGTLLVYVASWLCIAGAVFALAEQVTGDRLAGAAAVVGTLVLTPQWTLGGNDLVHTVLVPSMAAWGLGLWGIVLLLRGFPVRAGLLVGLAAWMQGLVGLHLAGAGAFMLLGRALPLSFARLRPLAAFGLAFLTGGLPALGPLVAQQLGDPPVPPEAPLFYIMAAFRNPHHYLFFSFPARALLRFGLLATAGVGSFVFLYGRGRLRHARAVGAALGYVALAGLVGGVFTERFPVLVVAKLQLFGATVLAKALFVSLAAGAAAALLPPTLWVRLDGWMRRGRPGAVVVAAAWGVVLAAALAGPGFLSARVPPLRRGETAVGAVEAWARTQTPVGAVFAVPPSWSGFRTHARRAIAINFKAFPYRDRAVLDWYRRLRDWAPLDPPERGGPDLQARLDAAYHGLPAATLLRLARAYGVTYVVRDTPPGPASPAFEVAFAAGPWRVYRVPGVSGPEKR